MGSLTRLAAGGANAGIRKLAFNGAKFKMETGCAHPTVRGLQPVDKATKNIDVGKPKERKDNKREQ